jgi:hypothetical protein
LRGWSTSISWAHARSLDARARHRERPRADVEPVSREDPPSDLASGEPGTPQGGPLEARLAGVVVAALQEAFDRDRARMELERSQVEAEQRRAAEALAAELRRQASERALGQLRLIAVIAVAVWMLSAALAVWLPGMRAGLPRGFLAGGWALLFASLGGAFAGWQGISDWTTGTATLSTGNSPSSAGAAWAPWLLLGALGLVASALLMAL